MLDISLTLSAADSHLLVSEGPEVLPGGEQRAAGVQRGHRHPLLQAVVGEAAMNGHYHAMATVESHISKF